jgi:protein N-terminal glutamine amidohydrolase
MPPPTAPTFDAAWARRQRYQPFFCEENVWQLLHAQALPRPAAAVFVANAGRAVAMWGQRAARRDPIVWDYHVVALLPSLQLVVDLDDRERAARPLAEWLAHAFREDTAPDLQPRFRIVPADAFVAVFSTDRSHMRDDDGRWRQPQPPWPAPFQPSRGMNLMRFVDVADAIAGIVTDAAGLLAWAPPAGD